MNEILLNLDSRTAEGKKVVALRASGYIPSVVYGGHDEPVLTQSKTVETIKVVRVAGRHTPINVVLDGKKHMAIIKTIDMDPVKHSIRHLAFHTINKNDVITTEVAIVLKGIGESPAERAGLVILQAIESIEVKAKPADLPESLELSIDSLATVDDKLTIGDIKLPAGVEFDDVEQDMELVIANVYEPGALQAANDASGGEAEDVSEVKAENGGEEATGDSASETESK